jgi:hypothetical protein
MPNICKEAMTRFVDCLVALRTLSIKKQDYGFDYSDGDGVDDAASADVENMYYTAKCL